MPYEIKKYSRGADGLAPPELKAVNPLGTAPVITDGTRNLAESGAIVGEFISRPYVTSAPPRVLPCRQIRLGPLGLWLDQELCLYSEH